MLTNKGHLKKIMNHEKFKKPWIMITGGLGYIGSHIVAALLESKEFQDRDFVFMIFDVNYIRLVLFLLKLNLKKLR